MHDDGKQVQQLEQLSIIKKNPKDKSHWADYEYIGNTGGCGKGSTRYPYHERQQKQSKLQQKIAVKDRVKQRKIQRYGLKYQKTEKKKKINNIHITFYIDITSGENF